MANWATVRFEKLGKSLLASAGKTEDAIVQRRFSFFGTELVGTRAAYLDYQQGVNEFVASYKAKTLTGKDLWGVTITAVSVFSGFIIGSGFAKGTFAPLNRTFYFHYIFLGFSSG